MNFTRRMSALPLRSIRLTDRFWTEWQTKLRDVTLEAEYQQIVATGRLRNFQRAAEGSGDHVGLYFNDSDVYKWCEACAYALSLGPHSGLQKRLDEVVSAITAAQEPSGYLNTFFRLAHPNLKWRNLGTMHEMYCAGHLFEAGAALKDEIGDSRLLDVSVKFADHIMSIFGPDKRRGYCGHQEIEIGLLRLARATGDAKYGEFARWMIEQRGHRPSPFEAELDDPEALALSPWAPKMLNKSGAYSGEYAQDHAPIREHTEIVGHAVRAMYFYIAATEFAEGDEELQASLRRIWENLTRKRMYVTGGIGPSASNEGFTGDYDLPNLTAYAETCAAIGLVFWGRALLEHTGDGQYAEVVERALYNGVMSGISETGDRFFYTNPLESRGTHARVPWFDCACCPPNIARLMGSAARYVASVSDDAFWIHIPAGFEAETTIKGVKTRIVCSSEYPFDGKLSISVEPEAPVEFELRFRIPDWADDVETDLPGLENESEWEEGYAVFRKRWSGTETLTVDLGIEPRWTECNPKVMDNLGRVALTRGPLVYCAESRDNAFAPQLFMADVEAPLADSDEGVTAEGFRERDEFTEELYAPIDTLELEQASLKFIPYYRWNNREPSCMQVWVRRA